MAIDITEIWVIRDAGACSRLDAICRLLPAITHWCDRRFAFTMMQNRRVLIHAVRSRGKAESTSTIPKFITSQQNNCFYCVYSLWKSCLFVSDPGPGWRRHFVIEACLMSLWQEFALC